MFKKVAFLTLVALFTSGLFVNASEVKVPDITLNNGTKIPQFGLGTYAIKEGDEAYNSVMTALKSGYRHIDTAHAYGNERSVGKAIKDSGVPREEIWVTSKLWPNEFGEGTTTEALDRMLKRLDLDYIDLVYLHQPVGDYDGAWKDLIKAQKEGKVRALGISNFDKKEELFDEFIKTAEFKPQIMQIECHPYAQRTHWQKKLKANGIQQENWFPLGGRESGGVVLKDKTLAKIAKAHNKSIAQIIIRWHIQKGFVVIPGASNPDYIKENIEVFDWSLTDKEMKTIEKLNQEHRFYDFPFEQQKQWYLERKLID